MAMNQKLNRRSFAALIGAGALISQTANAQDTGAPGETGSALPAADLPTMNEQGHTFEMSSTFEGNYDSVPTEAPVYKMELLTYNADQVKDLAERLGVDGEVNDLGGDTFSVESREAQMHVTQGRVQYMSFAAAEEGELQSDDAAITTAREWLRERGLLPGDVGDGSVLSRADEHQRIIVGFQPVKPSPLISSTPNVTVSMGPNGQVLEATNAWASLTQDQVYQLRGGDLAWEEVETRRAWVDASLPTDDYPAGSTIGGAVVYNQLSLAYTSSGVPGENQFLQPVYVFRGDFTPDGAEKSYTVRAYVPAIINSNQPVGQRWHTARFS